jgi:invasion protein IalB
MNRDKIFNNIIKVMKSRYTILVFIAAAVAGIFALSHNVVGQESDKKAEVEASAVPEEEQKNPWSVRCNELAEGEEVSEAKRGRCEVYQRLVMAESGQRLAEFAIGFPEDQENARGVVIMPLGILLNPGVQMMIDDGDPFTFKVRYCNQGGCFAYLSLSEEVLKMLKKGNEASFLFMEPGGKTVRVNMSLMGLTKALKGIQ